MTIFILDQDPKKTAKYLDDKSLDQMIGDLTSVLICFYGYKKDYHYPSASKIGKQKLNWYQWARECESNYLYLVELGLECLRELVFRRDNKKLFYMLISKPLLKRLHVLNWARNNVPDLREYRMSGHPDTAPEEVKLSDFPLVMPKKYKISDSGYKYESSIKSYRNYYQAKLKQRHSLCLKNMNNPNLVGQPYQRCPKMKWTNRQRPEWLAL